MARAFALSANSGHRIEDHFVDITEMVAIGSGAQRPFKTVLLSRYARCIDLGTTNSNVAEAFGASREKPAYRFLEIDQPLLH